MTSPKLSASSIVCVLAGDSCGEGGSWTRGIQAIMKANKNKTVSLALFASKRISRLLYKSKSTRRLFASK
jgi:hypothetical protein